MIRVILESPFAGDVERNIKYARACVRHSLSLGEAPIASHLLYTQEGILNDDIPEERVWGIDAGLAWKVVAEKHVFYVDYGMSRGMEYAMKYATENKIPVEIRTLYTQEKVMGQAESTINARERALKLIQDNAVEIVSLMHSEKKDITEDTPVKAYFDDLDLVDLCMHLERDIHIGIPDEEVEEWITFKDVVDSCEKRM